MCKERYRCRAERSAKSTYKNLWVCGEHRESPLYIERRAVLLSFRKINYAAGQDKVVPAYDRDDARDWTFILPRTHRHKLTAR